MQFHYEIKGEVITISPYHQEDCEISIEEFDIESVDFLKYLVDNDIYKPVKTRATEWDDIGDYPLFEYGKYPYYVIKSHLEFYLLDNKKKYNV